MYVRVGVSLEEQVIPDTVILNIDRQHNLYRSQIIEFELLSLNTKTRKNAVKILFDLQRSVGIICCISISRVIYIIGEWLLFCCIYCIRVIMLYIY